MPSFYDPNMLQIDPSLLQLARQPEKPVGFWDKMKAANSNNLVLGMQPDEFSMFMGSIGQALMPDDHPIGRLAGAVYGHGKMKRDQRMEAQKPENRIAEAKTRALLGEQAPDPSTQGLVAGVPQTSLTLADPMGVFAREGQAREMSLGPLANQLTQGQIAETNASTAYKLADTNRLTQMTPFELQKMQADTRHSLVQADVAQQMAPSQIELAKANAALAGKQNQYYYETNVNQPRQQISQGWSNINLRGRELTEGIRVREAGQAAQLNEKFSMEISNTMDQYNKQIADPLNRRNAPALNFNAGRQLISQGLQHTQTSKGFAQIDGGAGLKSGAQAISQGVQYIVSGINQAPDIKTKVQLTQELIGQIDAIRATQPGVADALEQTLFKSPGSAIGGAEKKYWFKKDETFDPYTVYQSLKGGKRR